MDSSTLNLLVTLMERQLELQLQYAELQKSQISLLADQKTTSSPVAPIAANPHQAECVLKPVTPMCSVPEMESPPHHRHLGHQSPTEQLSPPSAKSKFAWAIPEDKRLDARAAAWGASPETEHPRAAWGFADDRELLRHACEQPATPPGSSDSSKYAATLPLSATISKSQQGSAANGGALAAAGAVQRPHRRLDKKIGGSPSIVVQVRPHPGARAAPEQEPQQQEPQASRDTGKAVRVKASPHGQRIEVSPRRVEVSPKSESTAADLVNVVNVRTKTIAEEDDAFPPRPPAIDEEEDGPGRKEGAAKNPQIGGTTADSWQVELPVKSDCTNNDSKHTITVLKAALDTNTETTMEEEPLSEPTEPTEIFSQFSGTSKRILELLGMLPARAVPRWRRLYQVLCISYAVSFAAMVVLAVGTPAIFPHLDAFPWWVQMQQGVFFASLCAVWLFVRRQFAQSNDFGTLVQQARHGQFKWATIDWYGRIAMLSSIGLALALYASLSGCVWLRHAQDGQELSWEDRVYLIVVLVFLAQPSAVACCFPWLLFVLVQLHCHDMRNLVAAMQDWLHQGEEEEQKERKEQKEQKGEDDQKVMRLLHKQEAAVASRLRQSSASWGFATLLLILASLDLGTASLIDLLVVQDPSPVLLPRLIIVGFSLVLLPVLLLALAARAADFFRWEVVPAINSPLSVLGEVKQKKLGSVLLMHLRALQATWGLCVGGHLIDTGSVARFASGAVLVCAAAMYQVAARHA